MKRLLFFIGLLYPLLLFGQKVDTTLTPGQLYDMANAYMAEEEYTLAIPYLERIIKLEPNTYKAYVDLGYCYMHSFERFKAVEYLEKAVDYYKKQDKLYTPEGEDAYFTLGEAYLMNYEFEMACEIFDDLIANAKSKRVRKKAEEQKAECQRAREFFNNPRALFVTYLDYINSEYPDHSPVLTLDERYLYFTSRRPGSTGGEKAEDGLPYEDIYFVDKQQEDPKVINLGPPVNTPKHEATCDISADGTELLIYKSSPKDKGDIYYSKKENGQWSEPVRLPEPINSKYRESHASFSADGRYLFFTSDRPGGYGGLDIYIAERDENGNWTNVKNLGNVINTDKDEEGPFLAPDGKTLYFSSKGHKTMGGYDVFKATMNEDGTWNEPENLGFPLNTVDDDIFYFPTATPNKAYYASTQQTGEANIYIVELTEGFENITVVKGHTFDTFLDTNYFTASDLRGDTLYFHERKIFKPRQVFFRKNDTVYISYLHKEGDKVILYDSICKVPKNTRIYDYNVATKKIIEIYNPAHSSGKYAFAIATDVEHLILYKAPNYVYDLLKLPVKSGNVYFDAELDTIVRGKVRSEKKTVFDPNTSVLSPAQQLEFIILGKFMKEYPFVWVELSAYPYDEQKEPYDDARMRTIYNYLVGLGIDSSRIKFTYSNKPVNGDTVIYTITDIQKLIASNEPVTEPKKVYIKKAIMVRDINFEINKYQNPAAYPDLNLLAEYLKDNPSAKVAIYGYTDTQGPANYNKELSKKRANFVKNYLLSKGVNPNQIVAEGKGFTKQISKNKDEKGNYIWNSLPYNRRVEIEVLQQGENQLLYVKPIEVPKEYQLRPENKKIVYSVMVAVSDHPLNADQFPFDVVEIKTLDGSYQYITGEFETEEEANQFKDSIIKDFPKAYVFINDYRN